MKPTMKELLKEWRENLNEHATDEKHDHPHGDESNEDHCGDESLNESEIGLGASSFEGWVGNDDSVYPIGTPGTSGVYEWACDSSGGTAELEYIIKRLRELYSLGGAIEKIEVLDMR